MRRVVYELLTRTVNGSRRQLPFFPPFPQLSLFLFPLSPVFFNIYDPRVVYRASRACRVFHGDLTRITFFGKIVAETTPEIRKIQFDNYPRQLKIFSDNLTSRKNWENRKQQFLYSTCHKR